jgi:hypothetical protein
MILYGSHFEYRYLTIIELYDSISTNNTIILISPIANESYNMRQQPYLL